MKVELSNASMYYNASSCLVYLTTSIPVFSEKKMRTEENVLHKIKLR